MSSSAITPVNIEITNNVPTNVPVVTAWESYTPIFESLGTVTGISFYWRRVGDTIEVTGNFTSGTPTSGIVTASLPSGLTLDTAKIHGVQTQILGYLFSANSTATSIPANNRGPFVVIDSTTGSTSKVFFAIQVDTGSGGIFPAVTGSSFALLNQKYTMQFRAPISQWAGSGTTTLANRAVEEYGSSTTGTWDAPAAVGNTVLGPGGSPITGDLSAVRSKVSRFSSTIQSTDWLILEFRNTAGNWIPSHLTNSSFLSAPPTFFGAYISSVSGTDVQVTFAQYAYPGATWGSTTGAGGWSASDAKAWRVRKVSSGSQVGYPVSARNIVGDTSGSAVPTGMIGEVVTWTTAPIDQAATSTTTDWNNATISLSAGVWLIQVGVQVSLTGQSVAGGNNIAVSLTTSSNSVLRTIYPLSTNVINSNYGGFGTIVNTVNITATTSYKIRFNVLTTNNGGSGSILNTANQSYFYAVRIA